MNKIIKLKIDKPVEKNYRNVYTVECEDSSGDGDVKHKIEVDPFQINKDEKYLEELIQLCEVMKKEYANGMDGLDTYNHIEGFDVWFGGEILEHIDENDPYLNFYQDAWPSNPLTDYRGHAIFKEYKVYFYDSSRIKYHVNVEFEQFG